MTEKLNAMRLAFEIEYLRHRFGYLSVKAIKDFYMILMTDK